jgi:hypothetical protein
VRPRRCLGRTLMPQVQAYLGYYPGGKMVRTVILSMGYWIVNNIGVWRNMG